MPRILLLVYYVLLDWYVYGAYCWHIFYLFGAPTGANLGNSGPVRMGRGVEAPRV